MDLRIEGLQREGLEPVTLTIKAGECVGISGPSGAGKSLLLRTLADLDPYVGEVYLGEHPCAEIEAPAWRRQVMLLPAESQWWYESVGEHFSKPDPRSFKALGFDQEVLTWSVARLSTGERQRLALLRCLEQQPRVLLLDEPTASLDPESTKRVEAMIHDFLNDAQHSVVWVGHDSAQLLRVADRRFRMTDGVLEEQVGDTS
ncbi:MAG: ATP-binding cassette domain-containing protein [Gammaproteobacteria bacterium]|nr:MAG: ATP-binding cassette domain-containing protein [Gammaproteobacteria bacterium]